jgi:hypothetical protein
LLEKEVRTDKGVPAKYWRPNQFIYNLYDETIKIELFGFVTKDAKEHIAVYYIETKATLPEMDMIYDIVEASEQWQNLK